MIKGIKPRLYQETILATSAKENSLVVLPTGLGKTMVAMMVAAQRLNTYPNSKVVFLSPTKPLAEQHFQTFTEHFEVSKEEMMVFTGNVAPSIREKEWREKKIIFSTPQGMENDVISNRVKLEDVSLIVFDEAHRAVGDYAYVYIAEKYSRESKYPLVLGLTASPGSEKEKIIEICQNLGISNIEIRTPEDADVKPYVKETSIKWVEMILPEAILDVKKYLELCYISKLEEVKQKRFLNNINISKTDLLALQRMLFAKAGKEKDFEAMKALSLVAEALKVGHALELLETQGIYPLVLYLRKLQTESQRTTVKALKNLVRDLNFKTACIKAENLLEQGVEHPKFSEVVKVANSEVSGGGRKVMIFSQYRDTAGKIVEKLCEEGVMAELFVGQAKKGTTGLSQKKQVALLDRFRAGEFPVLVATSVAEEGIDIPHVNAVLFYEPIPSSIRTIQRRGRTGRHEEGKVYVFVTKGTRDEGYRWSAFHKERRMIKILRELRDGLRSFEIKKDQQKLTKYSGEKWKVYVDHREKGSAVVKELMKEGADIELKQLSSGDFLLSERVGVEYKTKKDFLQSLIDGRLLEQAKYLRMNFLKPIMIIEGSEEIYSIRKIHPSAIRGAISSIVVDFGIPIIFSADSAETASYLLSIAKREQAKGFNVSIYGERTPKGLREQQEHIISSFPGIGPTLAKPLLEEFRSVKKVVNASEEELQRVKLIGKKKAQQFKEIVEKEYGEDDCL